ncbi:hypothetical protein [Methylobacterium indicum]|uniref:Uncharacterized protein n=1 Tax=Methylobacterium indicum TaxID=1775910 RepID=A0A8H9CA73_9HYPH|nr:hypothetical protein [Methylobacterium indicum]BCM87846.1 hypothetical protein mvi_63070 [Methylobacterium indicum]
MTRACKNCEFFEPFTAPDEATLVGLSSDNAERMRNLGQSGLCRINPPTRMWEVALGYGAAFPPVGRDEWCGHFNPSQRVFDAAFDAVDARIETEIARVQKERGPLTLPGD